MTAALKARQAGWIPTLVDRAPHTTDESRAVGINRASLNLLEDTGVVPALLARGEPFRRIRLFYKTKPLATFDLPLPDGAKPMMIGLPQSETERILLKQLDSLGVETTWNTHISSVSQTADGVSAIAESGETFEADWLLGADGSRSVVRDALGIEMEGSVYPETWSMIDADVDWPWPDTQASPHLQPDGSVLFFVALGAGRFRIIANRDDVQTRAEAIVSINEVFLSDTFTISLKRVQHYGEGRIWIAGDAAHVHSPVGGMGMNLGMEDAADFVATLTGGASKSDFAGYAARRLIAAKRVLRVSDRGYQLATTTNPVVRATRNAAIRLVSALGPAQRWLLRVVFRTRDQN